LAHYYGSAKQNCVAARLDGHLLFEMNLLPYATAEFAARKPFKDAAGALPWEPRIDKCA